MTAPRVLVLMGVSGSGKTTVAKQLAGKLGWAYQEGDALHPKANVDKMHAGIPLDDEDRKPWLTLIAAWIDARLAAGEPGIVTCSALKRKYRDMIIGPRQGVQLVYLHGDKPVLQEHLAGRHHEYMPTTLLDSQLATLEEPHEDEHVIEVDVAGSIEHTVDEILRRLG